MMKTIVKCLVITFSLLLMWQAIVSYWHVPDYLLPSPLSVAYVFQQQASVIASEAVPTIIETLLGLACGLVFGCLAGFSIAYCRPLSFWLLPLLIVSQAIPTFAIAPLIVIWLGYGMASKVAVATLMIFFPITSACYDGLRRTPTGWLDLASSMNSNPWRIFLHIRIPAAMPDLAAGLRIAAVIAPIGAIVGEWVGSSQGLGYFMLNANARMQIDMVFAALLVIIVLSLTLYFSVDKLLRTYITWE